VGAGKYMYWAKWKIHVAIHKCFAQKAKNLSKIAISIKQIKETCKNIRQLQLLHSIIRAQCIIRAQLI